MPLFLSDEEFRRASHDAGLVAEKADAFIRDLYVQIETVKAESAAASITAEQTFSLVEQRYVSLTEEYASLQSKHAETNSSLEQRGSELGEVQAEKQQLVLKSIEKDGEIERLTREASELHKSKRQLLEMLEQKDLEISEKNAAMKSYLDKIVNLTEIVASKEARLGDVETELSQLRGSSARYLQEKELLERHNTWLNEELTAKVDSLIQLRKANGELEADMSAKLADLEVKLKESSSSVKQHKDRVMELEAKLASMEEELLSNKDAAAAAEERFSAEISTVTKLVELYKESSEEWSKKAGELEGVIKALETHLNQVENEYKDKLEKEMSSRKNVEKDYAELNKKLQISEVELEKLKKENELNHLPLSSITTSPWSNIVDTVETVVDDRAIVPRIPAGVSGTALAASLLRDGWSLAKMYAKYQEAVDALRHEQLGRKQAQAILERVLYEIEQKAGVIMDEREEHDRLVEAYSSLNEKLQHSLSEHSSFQTTIEGLKAGLKKQERDYAIAQKEVENLEKQIAVLLKECRDVQLRCGSVTRAYDDDDTDTGLPLLSNGESGLENIVSERLLTYKDINGLVEQNVQLRSLVRHLSHQIEENEAELKDKYEKELRRHTDMATSKVNTVLLRAEEQANMIESLHNSVAMYKKLYEEEHKLRSSPQSREALPEQGSREIVLFHEKSRETTKREREHERVKKLEEDFAKSRSDLISLRAERDKLALEAQFAQEKLSRFMKDFEHQREEHNGVISRNVEFSQLIINYQKQLRESSESVDAANELSRKLTMEVSILKNEKEILQNSEKRASDENRSLSERLHRMQASSEIIQSTEEAREEARGIERRKQEEYTKKIEREWAEAKRELQEERDRVRNLMQERVSTMRNDSRQVEELSKELSKALQSVAAAESRAAVAEARCSDLEKVMESARTKGSDGAEDGLSPSSSEKILANLQDEITKWREEAEASKDHMHQYKSIAQTNEAALKQIELIHEEFKTEADKIRSSLEAEVCSLRARVNELENECKLKTEEANSAASGMEEAHAGLLSEIASLKDDCSVKMSQIVVLESQLSAFKEDSEKEHQRWQIAQGNYERQVVLQSETIQELTKTSQALASLQEETSELRGLVDVLKTEKNELQSKWDSEKSAIELYRSEADKKYNEVDELNKLLHSRLEALHIKLADKEVGKASGSSSQAFAADDGLQNVVTYLRRSKEIAETEISLLKQEKLRLQSQLENALKSAETAQALLNSERAKSRASLLSEDEFKSLQSQIRELNLLRESNVQLREENRNNFEECQKLRETLRNVRVETENVEKLHRDREVELETQRKEIENLKSEKGRLEKRLDELVDKYKEVDVDEYNRLKESFQQLQVNLREKDSHLEEVKKLLSEKQDAISALERDLAKSRTELTERETRINEISQAEASLKSEMEKFRRNYTLVRRKSDSLAKEKDSLLKEKDNALKEKENALKEKDSALKEKDSALKEKDSALKEKDSALKDKENIMKEKEDLSKEIQALNKQLEDSRQVRRNLVDSGGEQTLREKEKEKETRIKMLERTLERERENLKKEKDERSKEKDKNRSTQKTILESHERVIQHKKELSGELDKHKQALKSLQDEVEKLKNPNGSQSESTSVTQHIATTLLDDFASAYFQAVEKFEQVAQPASAEVDSSTTVDAPPQDNMPSVGATVGQSVTTLSQTPVPPPGNVPPKRTLDDRERRLALGKANLKMGRKLVRPNITKPKETQGDMEMSEADEPNTGSSLVRKRSDSLEEIIPPEEATADMPGHALKRSKPSESSLQDSGEEPSAAVKLPEVSVPEESSDDVENLQQGSKEELVDAEKDDSEMAEEQMDDLTAEEQVQAELLPSETVEVEDEKSDKPGEETAPSDDQLRDQTEKDVQQIILESSEREEGELDDEAADNDGDSNVPEVEGGSGVGDFQTEQSIEPENSSGVEPAVSESLEAGEIDTSQTPEEEKESGEITENPTDSSNKLPDAVVGDPIPETDQTADPLNSTVDEASTSTSVGNRTPERGGSPLTTDTGGKPVSPLNSSSTTINLQERARLRSQLRQGGGQVTSTPTPTTRARGRAIRGRGFRGGRTPRGQSPG